MSEIVIMPKQGLQMTEGLITQWLIPEGGQVKQGEPLFEMETDKLVISIDAPASGTLLKILCEEGESAPVAAPIAVIGAPGEDYRAALPGGMAQPEKAAASEPPAPSPAVPAPAPAAEAPVPAGNPEPIAEPLKPQPVTQAPQTPAVPAETGRTFVSPRAKTRAAQIGLDYHEIRGSGPMGMVVERDILEHSAVELPAAPSRGTTADRKVPISNMRRIIARRMVDSLQTLAQACHRITADMSEAKKLREQFKACDIKISYNDIVIRCVARALTEFPMVNASMDEQSITLHADVNVGMAVATDSGLLVPVIRNADRMTLPEIASCSKDLAARTKGGKLSPDELTGATFTVTNLGMFDIESFTAVINKPEAGILAVGKMEDQPVVIGGEIAIRPRMQLSLTYDHRILDGAPAAKILRRVKQLLENPGLLI